MGSSPASFKTPLRRGFFIVEDSLDQPLFLLASGSPRRKVILESLGFPFQIVPNSWEEVSHPRESAIQQVRRLAREKLESFVHGNPRQELPVLTADTLLEWRGRPINKPQDEHEAWETYQTLAGRWHRVLTSVVWHVPRHKKTRQFTVATQVRFVAWDADLYRRYLARGEWKDAAGGYKIQEAGSVLVSQIRGSWTNVVGLPSAEVYDMISQTLRVPARRPPGAKHQRTS